MYDYLFMISFCRHSFEFSSVTAPNAKRHFFLKAIAPLAVTPDVRSGRRNLIQLQAMKTGHRLRLNVGLGLRLYLRLRDSLTRNKHRAFRSQWEQERRCRCRISLFCPRLSHSLYPAQNVRSITAPNSCFWTPLELLLAGGWELGHPNVTFCACTAASVMI